MEEMLTKKCTYCSIHCFDKVDSKLINFLENNEITLYIIDIELGDKSNKGTDLALKIAHNKTGSIILFMSGYDYTINSFSDFKGKVIYDFIKKPFSYEELASRISVLLNVSQTYNELETRLRNTRHAVWDMMNYTKMFVVILDENLKVKIANWYLATELGFENEDDLLDKCWLQFVDEQLEYWRKKKNTKLATRYSNLFAYFQSYKEIMEKENAQPANSADPKDRAAD